MTETEKYSQGLLSFLRVPEKSIIRVIIGPYNKSHFLLSAKRQRLPLEGPFIKLAWGPKGVILVMKPPQVGRWFNCIYSYT